MFKTLQICRAFAAIVVVCFHTSATLATQKYFGAAADPLRDVFWFGGRAGVAFFFVLSGFIIAHVHWKDVDRPGKLLDYFRKRATRIYPAYWIIFFSVYFAALLVPATRDTVPSDISILIKSIFLLPQDAAVVGKNGAPVLDVAWSLQFEVVFYAAFALAIVNRWLFAILLCAFSINLILQPYFGPYPFPQSFFARHHIFLFLMGMVTSMISRSRLRLPNPGRLIALSSLAFLMICAMACLTKENYDYERFDLAYGGISGILVFCLIRFESGLKQPLGFDRLSMVGDSSYVLYLLHVPVISLVSRYLVGMFRVDHLGAFLVFVGLVSGCILLGLAFHAYIEKPVLRMLSPRRVVRPPINAT